MPQGSDLAAVEIRNAATRLLNAVQKAESIADIDFPAIKPDLIVLLRSTTEQHLPLVD